MLVALAITGLVCLSGLLGWLLWLYHEQMENRVCDMANRLEHVESSRDHLMNQLANRKGFSTESKPEKPLRTYVRVGDEIQYSDGTRTTVGGQPIETPEPHSPEALSAEETEYLEKLAVAGINPGDLPQPG